MTDNYQSMMNHLEEIKKIGTSETQWLNMANFFRGQKLSSVLKQTPAEPNEAVAYDHYLAFCLTEIVSQNPNHIQCWWELAFIYTFSTTLLDDSNAFFCLQKCAELDPTNSAYWSQMHSIAAHDDKFNPQYLAILKELMLLTRDLHDDKTQDFSKLLKVSNLANQLGMNVILRPLVNAVQKISQANEAVETYTSTKNQVLIFHGYRQERIVNKQSFENLSRPATPAPAQTTRLTPNLMMKY